MKVEVYIMDNKYQLRKESVDLQDGSTVGDCLALIEKNDWIENIQPYAVSRYGQRVKPGTILVENDRIELSVALPSDPMIRRRLKAISNKNR